MIAILIQVPKQKVKNSNKAAPDTRRPDKYSKHSGYNESRPYF